MSLPLGSSLPGSWRSKHDTYMPIFLEFCSRMAKRELASNIVLFHSLKSRKKQPLGISSPTHSTLPYFLGHKRASDILTWNGYLPLLLPFHFTPVHIDLTAAVQRHGTVVTCHLYVFICQNSNGGHINLFSGLIFKNIYGQFANIFTYME